MTTIFLRLIESVSLHLESEQIARPHIPTFHEFTWPNPISIFYSYPIEVVRSPSIVP